MCVDCPDFAGLRQEDLDSLRTSVLHCYGFDNLFKLQALEDVGLLTLGRSRFGLTGTEFDKNKAALGLVVDPSIETAAMEDDEVGAGAKAGPGHRVELLEASASPSTSTQHSYVQVGVAAMVALTRACDRIWPTRTSGTPRPPSASLRGR